MDERCLGVKRSGERCQYHGYRGFCGIHERQRQRQRPITLPPHQIVLPQPPHVVLPHVSETNSLERVKSIYEEIIINQKEFIDMLMVDKENDTITLNLERLEYNRLKITLDKVRKNLKEAHLFTEELCFKIDLYKIKNVIDNTNKEKDCCICYDGLKNSVVTKCCRNEICLDCLYNWGVMKIENPTCPICRASLYID